MHHCSSASLRSLADALIETPRQAQKMSDRAFAVRRATTEVAYDLAHLAEITFAGTFGHLSPPEDRATYVGSTYTPEACSNTLSDPRMACWLVGAEDEPAAGFAVAGYCKLPVKDLQPTAGELRQLYVKSIHQNRRLGTLLFETAL